MLLGRLPDGVGHGGWDDDGSSAFHQASLLHPLFQEPLVPVELAAPRAKFSDFKMWSRPVWSMIILSN